MYGCIQCDDLRCLRPAAMISSVQIDSLLFASWCTVVCRTVLFYHQNHRHSAHSLLQCKSIHPTAQGRPGKRTCPAAAPPGLPSAILISIFLGPFSRPCFSSSSIFLSSPLSPLPLLLFLLFFLPPPSSPINPISRNDYSRSFPTASIPSAVRPAAVSRQFTRLDV